MRYDHILSLMREQPWALQASKWLVIREFMAERVAGVELTAEEIRDRIGAAAEHEAFSLERDGGKRGENVIAVLPLMGTIVPRGSSMNTSGITSAEEFTKQFKALDANGRIGTIVLDVDSPGGNVMGVAEAAAAIQEANTQVVAVANHAAASAAYWIAAAADELVVAPGAVVGAIGVFQAHEDISGRLEKEGIKVTITSAGKFKSDGLPLGPLSEEAQAAAQRVVDEAYAAFVQAVATGRGVSVREVRNGFGEGAIVTAQQALALGMADSIETLDQVLERLGGLREAGRTPARAEDAGAAEESWDHSEAVRSAAGTSARGQREIALRRRQLARVQGAAANAPD